MTQSEIKNILLDTNYYEEYENQNHYDATMSTFMKIKEKQNGEFLVTNLHQALQGQHPPVVTNMYVLTRIIHSNKFFFIFLIYTIKNIESIIFHQFI